MKRFIFQTLFFTASFTLFYLPLGAAEDDTRGIGVRESQQPSTYALLIGIDDYQGNARNLKCAVKDTLGLAETLKNIGVPEDRIRVVSDNSLVKPSAQNIRRQVELICKIVTEDDNLLISFSCHGVEDEKDQSEAYFCPNDLNRKDINTFISRRWVEKEIEKSKARKKVLIADCCQLTC